MPRLNYEYIAPKSVDEAIKAFYQGGERTFYMAGGTDLLVKIQHRLLLPRFIIGLKNIDGLDRITFDEEKGLTIGALALLGDVSENKPILKYYPALSLAALSTANVQIRNMGTLVGNLCNASPSADNAPSLIALDAIVHINGEGRQRVLPIADFFKGPGVTALERGEMVTGITVPPPSNGLKMAYYPLSARGSLDCSAVGVGVAIVLENHQCVHARIAIGACAPTPIRAFEAEKMLMGEMLTEKTLKHVALKAAMETHPISDVRASAWYRKKMVEVATFRAIESACST